MKTYLLPLTTVAFTLVSFNVSATVRYVDVNSASPAPPYTNWATAAKTIQDAVDIAVDGDQILTTNGVYANGGRVVNGSLTNRVVIDKAVTVQSVNGPTTTVIDGGGAVRCVSLTNGASLSGFTLTNGVDNIGNGGGGVWCSSTNAVVTNCVIAGNSAFGGGGAAGGTLYHCTLTGNSGVYGGGAEACNLNNCTLVNNGASYGGGADGSDLNNCLVVSNTVNATGAGVFDSTLDNCTVWGNIASDGTGGIEGCAAQNCIIFDNDPANYRWGSLDYCCTEPFPGDGSGNFSGDPLLIDPLGGNFQLQSNSPCVNQGNNGYVASTTDLDGNPRIFEDTVDMGAYEFQTSVPLRAMIHPESTNAVLGYDLNLTGSTLGGIGTTNSWDFGDGTGASNLWSVAHTWTTAGDYPVTLTVFNDANPGGVNATIIIHVLTQILYYVDAKGTNPVAPFSSWDKAATTVQDVVDIAMAGATVVVNDGAYAPFGGNKPLNIHSVNGPATTMVDGGGAQRCVYLAGGATLSGFMLTNGATGDNGGGVFCEAATTVVSNCVFVGNSASSHSGGGAFGGTLSHCILTNNVAYAGGAASYCTLGNCAVMDNSAEEGGGAYFCSVNNCTLVSNTASEGGAAYESQLNDCIVYYNSAPSGPDAFDCSLNYCATPAPGGTGNITNEPVFVNLAGGDFHLQSNSPCINAGNNSYVATTNDLDGNPRIAGGTVDIGAYEFQNPASLISYAWLQQYGLPNNGSADFTDFD
ncbi:MAG TPA: choice-of-anchor Q domain-containing protein, partial [Candidatus Acidoferrum sp.]|nr:choice-of-anchor Q domain-containing protein [Candidatus Acidoferrum sp.]